MQKTNRIYRSIGFRTNRGRLIHRINSDIVTQTGTATAYDMIWVDKANFITPQTTFLLRKKTPLLVHFTPDCAFYSNRSHLFEKGMGYYDWFVSSKTFERNNYPKDKLIIITQAFDKRIHKPIISFEEKTRVVSFIGLYEPSRGEMMDTLLNAGIGVAVAGIGWNRYKNIHHPKMEYLGEKVMGADYVKVIAGSLFSLGLLSKKFPELHTTRTFEIPACGTALISERNEETAGFFNEEEAIFFDSMEDIPRKIQYYLEHREELRTITIKGTNRVNDGGFDYESILQDVLEKMGMRRGA